MTNKQLEIIMRLKDEVTKRLEGIERALYSFRRGVASVGRDVESFGRTMGVLGKNMIFLGGAITGPLVLAFKNAEKYSSAVHTEMERLRNVTNTFQVSIANALIPVIRSLNNILIGALNAWERMDPALRNAILQTSLITGGILLLNGTILTLVSRLSILIGKFLGFVAANLPLVAIIASVALLIVYFDRLKNVAVPVLNAIEIEFKILYEGIMISLKAISQLIDANVLMPLEKVLTILEKLPARFGGGKFGQWKNDIAELREGFKSFGDVADTQANRAATSVKKIFSSGSGDLAAGIGNISNLIKKLPELLKSFQDGTVNTMMETFDYAQMWAQQTASAMSNALGDGFFNIMKGNFGDLKSVLANFGNDCLRIISQVIAKMLVMKMIMMAGGSFFGIPLTGFHTGGSIYKYHTGGMPRRAHTGYLASDEVPIITQTGEGIVSRRGMQAVGGSYGLNRINRGGSASREPVIHINIVQNMQTYDTNDYIRNKKSIAGAVISELESNGQIRTALKNLV